VVVEDLEDEMEVVDTRRDDAPADRLKSRSFTVVDGSEATPRWMIPFGLAFLFLAEAMVVSGKERCPRHVVRGPFYTICIEYR